MKLRSQIQLRCSVWTVFNKYVSQ